jgi:hypothetical protein
MIRVVLEIDNYTAESISPLEAVVKHILSSDLIRVDYTLFKLPYSWDKSKNKYTVEIKDIEQT